MIAGGRGAFFALFTVSGFAGLIYESIWSQYLKLFLGHAAYAQTLVLALFMGGMAAGAWLAARGSARWGNLLRGYAVAEALIGLAAIAFHQVFVAVTGWTFDSALPATGNEIVANAIKWSLAAALILPQAVLLGTTFPLMSAGIIRRHPERPGETLAMLYFTNSLGAAAGIVAAGFVMIERLGLPGTIQAAGAINLGLAAVVWMLAPGREAVPVPPSRAAAGPGIHRHGRLLIAVALLTGTASFIYEIGWIRMLALVLGSSTHSFELMLASFILGLAFGGFWIRRRIDRLSDPLRFLAIVQIAMGLAALATLPLYGSMFDLMQAVLAALARSEGGYGLFLVASHGIALLVMFPATFCAGMTLPLITYTLLAGGAGEKSIGSVYAANTLGAILGVVLAAHVGMPLLGLKGLITAGAALDVSLGLVLLWRVAGLTRMPVTTALATLALFGWIGFAVNLDVHKMASGVYRRGQLHSADEAKVVFYRDGKTTSVSLVQFDEGLSLRTNGKSDGAINLKEGARISDEVTMVMTAALPLAYRPDAKRAAVIGIGTGLTTHTLLGSPTLERVDTIEIEPAMAEAARRFAARNAAAFADPRSHIAFEDAKTYFAARRAKYDIIISEPSNPWVSGVSSLFSREFYRHVRGHLADDGVLVQWFQLYEIDITLVASVIAALAETFPEFAIYAATDSDILIVAGGTEAVSRPLADVFGMPLVGRELRRVHVQTIGDIEARRIGSRRTLLPLFLSFNVPTNSDYYPYLDLHAAKYRFLQTGAGDVTRIGTDGVPFIPILEGMPPARPLSLDGDDFLARLETARRARYARDFYLASTIPEPQGIPASFQKDLEVTRMRAIDCRDPEKYDIWLRSLVDVARVVNSGLSPAEAVAVWREFEQAPCHALMGEWERDLVALFAAVARRDPGQMAALASRLLAAERETSIATRRYLLVAGMTGYLAEGHPDRAIRLWQGHAVDAIGSEIGLDLRLLYAYATVAQGVGAPGRE